MTGSQEFFPDFSGDPYDFSVSQGNALNADLQPVDPLRLIDQWNFVRYPDKSPTGGGSAQQYFDENLSLEQYPLALQHQDAEDISVANFLAPQAVDYQQTTSTTHAPALPTTDRGSGRSASDKLSTSSRGSRARSRRQPGAHIDVRTLVFYETQVSQEVRANTAGHHTDDPALTAKILSAAKAIVLQDKLSDETVELFTIPAEANIRARTALRNARADIVLTEPGATGVTVMPKHTQSTMAEFLQHGFIHLIAMRSSKCFDPHGLGSTKDKNPPQDHERMMFGLFTPTAEGIAATTHEISARASQLLEDDRFVGQCLDFALNDNIQKIVNTVMRGGDVLGLVLRRRGVLTVANGGRFLAVILTSIHYCLFRRAFSRERRDAVVHQEIVLFGTRIDRTLRHKLAAEAEFQKALNSFINETIRMHVAISSPEHE
ncbi:hypothetical protein BV22DRAFT_1134668 [Leucogyrophana mollusca]|uniref:Uncharacterized protein n=1 Tax=Leucogyrophana mollusca TaxID=85980 RepID=A0ACB8AZP7_9AGAM|nr:hypothetical protein BV22DRAFT_1134668 [Leucogyrophana mollusca]